MNILFLHRNFPAQFLHLAKYLGGNPDNNVVFITAREEYNIRGVKKAVYNSDIKTNTNTHRYLNFYEESILHGQGAANVAVKLKRQGFVPDVIYGHSWGQTLFMKDIFPNSALLCYFEWFYNAHGADVDFANRINHDKEAHVRVKNSHILVDLYSCDHGLSPTLWQKNQFPKEFHHKIEVMHDGIDTNTFQPNPDNKLILPHLNLDLSDKKEIITYVGRGMEPYRGFPQFMESVAHILERRPNTHIVIVGQDRVCYGNKLPEGETYKKLMLERLNLDMSRVHFTGHLNSQDYLKVLQASSAHIYLTYPFVLSWSMLEAMSTGCIVIGSDTLPVKEVIEDGVNGLLVDFFNPVQIADRVDEVLDNQAKMEFIRQNARETILNQYSLSNLLPKHIDFLTKFANK